MIRADGRDTARVHDGRGLVVLSLRTRRLGLRGDGTGEWTTPRRPWRFAPPRGWAIASVAISEWRIESTGRVQVPFTELGLEAALVLGADDRLEVHVQGVGCGAPQGVPWRGSVTVQVTVYGPLPRAAANSIALPGSGRKLARRRVPSAARSA